MDLRESAFNAIPLSDSGQGVFAVSTSTSWFANGDNDAELICKMLDSGAGRRPNALS